MICTLKGRVVYDRKAHHMHERDGKRITEGIFKRNIPSPGFTLSDHRKWLVLMLYMNYGTIFLKDPQKTLLDLSASLTGSRLDIINFLKGLRKVGTVIGVRAWVDAILNEMTRLNLRSHYKKYIDNLIKQRRDPYGST